MPRKKATEEKAETAQPSDPTRCGGYVLTNEGWQLENPAPAESDDDQSNED